MITTQIEYRRIGLSRSLALFTVLCAVTAFYFISRQNYNLFHTVVDGISLVIGACVFVIAWNSRGVIDNNYYILVGIGSLFFAFLNFLHVIGNKDMNIFPRFGNLGPTFYIIGRYYLAITLVCAPFFIRRRLNTTVALVIYAVATLLLVFSVFSWKVFPATFIEGVGLTPFKVVSDYVICGILIAAIGLMFVNRAAFNSRLFRIVVTSIVLLIASGLTFTLYSDPFGVTNFIAHLFQIGSFYLVYIALVETGLRNPQEILFRKLKMNEEALSESEARFRLALKNVPVSVAMQDLNLRYFWAYNDGSERHDDILGKVDSDIFTPEEAAKIVDIKQRVIAQNTELQEQMWLHRADDKMFFDVHCEPIHDAAGRVTGVGSAMIDLTPMKQAEQEIRALLHSARQSEEQFKVLIHNLSSAAALIDEAGKFSVVNPSFLELFGLENDSSILNVNDLDWSRWEVYGENLNILQVKDHPVRKAAATGMRVTNQLVGVRNPGADELTWMLINVQPMYKEDGTLHRLVCTYYDITERRRAEEALRRSHDELEMRVLERTKDIEKERKRLYDVLETLPVILDIIRPDHRIEWTNRAFRESLGDCQGHLCYESQFGRDKPCDECQAFVPFETGQPHHWEWTLPNGRTFDIYNFPFTDADGSPLILEMDIDITEQRRLEDELRQSHKMEALGTLTGGIAHDFNNILAGIMGFTEMAMEDAPTDKQVQHHLERVLKGAMRGRDLVKQMLTFSRKTEYDVKPLSITSLIEETLKLLRATIPTTIKIEFAATAKKDTVLANATGIQQIVLNLATNAAHAMRENGGTLSVILSDACDKGPFLSLTINDTGTGMPPTVVKRIFEPFFTTKAAGQGTGMGLAVVYGIVKSFDGEISVHSTPGAGTVFQIYLPIAETEELVEDLPAVELPRGGEKILFVDDEELLADLGKRILERLGYKVTATTSSTEALRLFAQDPSDFDLVITDHTMPELTGLSLTRQLLQLRPGLPIILCTGYSETIDPEKVKTAGISEYFMKPLTKHELAVAVRRVLDSKTDM